MKKPALSSLRTLCTLVACSLALAGTAPAWSQPAPQKITAGIASYYEAFLPVYAAQQRGYFKEEGLEVEVPVFKGGGPAGQAFLSGSIDLCLCSFDHVLKLRDKKQDVVAIAGIEEFHAYGLVARKGHFASIADLKGKKIGITSPGSATDIGVRYELKHAGIDVKDVTLVSIGGANEMRLAIEKGLVDAGMVIGGVLVDMLDKPDYAAIIDFRTQRYPLEVVEAKREWLKANPELARKFLRALRKGQDLVQKDPKAAFDVTRSMFPQMDEKIVTGVSRTAVKRLSPDGSINREGVANITERQIFAGVIGKPIAYEELIDLSFLPK